ncbi:MAG TPA: endonuclease III [Trueperaceae bacterium]
MPREKIADKRTRATEVLARLRKLYPNARTELEYRSPFELLVAVILSAQATDAGVNRLTPRLFDRYPDASSLARATPEEVEPLINSIGLFRGKARNIVAAARILVEKHAGEVPDDFDALLELPGVGRKTANVVLGTVYGRPGIAVDTHVLRVSNRLGFTRSDDPVKVEKDLERLYPSEQWVFVHHALILHGRRICVARTPKCADCVLNDICPSSRV